MEVKKNSAVAVSVRCLHLPANIIRMKSFEILMETGHMLLQLVADNVNH